MTNSEKRKVIACFMGGVYEIHPTVGEGYRFSGEDITHFIWGSQVSFMSIRSLGYDINWNHLVAVMAKIKTTIPCPEDEYGALSYNNIFSAFNDTFNRELVFLHVAEFIEWYNDNKKQ